MRQKVRMIDKIDNKVVEGTVNVPAKDHLAAQITYPAKVFKSKKVYTRKKKYKPNYDKE